jgi:hypothetical protein
MRQRRIILTLANLALLGLAALGLVSCSRSAVEASFKPAQAAGLVAAEETLKLIQNRGQIVLITEDTSLSINEALDAQVEAFKQAIKKQKGVTALAIVKFARDPRTVGTNPGGLLTRDQLLTTAQAHPGAAAIVSFIGFPKLAAQDFATLQAGQIKCVAIFNSVFGVEIRKRVVQPALSLAIVACPEAMPAGATKPRTAHECFEQSYLLLKPEPNGEFNAETVSLLPDR